MASLKSLSGSIELVAVRIDASEALEQPQVNIQAKLSSWVLGKHDFSRSSGRCFVTAGATQLLQAVLINTTQAAPLEVNMSFSLKTVAVTSDSLMPVRLSCEAEIVADLFSAGCYTLRLPTRMEQVLDEPSAANLRSFPLKLVAGPTKVAWPSSSSPSFTVLADQRLELQLTHDVAHRLDGLLTRLPVHVKADVSFSDVAGAAAATVNGTMDAPLRVGRAGAALVIPVQLSASAGVPFVYQLARSAGRPVVLRAKNPSSPLAAVLGAEHTLGLACDEEAGGCGKDLSETSHHLRRALSQTSSTLAVSLHQRIMVDNRTLARADLNIKDGGSDDYAVDVSLIYRQLGAAFSMEEPRNATEVLCSMRIQRDKTVTSLRGNMKMLEEWYGSKSESQLNPDATNSSGTIAYSYNPDTQKLHLSAVLSNSTTDPLTEVNQTAFNVSSKMYSFNLSVALAGVDTGSFLAFHATAHNFQLAADWTVKKTADKVWNHELALAGKRSDGHRLFLAELAKDNPTPKERKLSEPRWYFMTTTHGLDETCGASSADRWRAVEEGYHAANTGVYNMPPDGDTACFKLATFRASFGCNATSGVIPANVFLGFDVSCGGSPVFQLGDLGRACHWDAENGAYSKDFCVKSLDDVPNDIKVHYRDGKILQPKLNVTVKDDRFQVPPPDNGLANQVEVDSGKKVVLSFVVDESKAASGAASVRGILTEEDSCTVKEEDDYFKAKEEKWLPVDFKTGDPQCRICSKTLDRGLKIWNNNGKDELYDYCVPLDYSQSCCKTKIFPLKFPVTWEAVLNPWLKDLGAEEMTADTPILGSKSWDRNTETAILSGDWTRSGSLHVSMEKKNDTFLKISTAWTDTEKDDRARGNLTFDWEGSGNATVISGHARVSTDEKVFGQGGFLAAAFASMTTPGEADSKMSALVESAASTFMQTFRLNADVGSWGNTDSALAFARSGSRSVLGARANATWDGSKIGALMVRAAEDETALQCAGSMDIESEHILAFDGSLAKSASAGTFQLELKSEGAVTGTASGLLPKMNRFFVGDVSLVSDDAVSTSLSVNVSDGWLFNGVSGFEEKSLVISGGMDGFQGNLNLQASAAPGTAELSSLVWQNHWTERMPNGDKEERLAGTASFHLLDSPPSTVMPSTTPAPRAYAAEVVSTYSMEEFPLVNVDDLLKSAALAHDAPAVLISSAYEVQFTHVLSTAVSDAPAKKALAALTGLPETALNIQLLPTTGATKMITVITTEDPVLAQNLLAMSTNAVVLEAAHALQGNRGTVSLEGTATSSVNVRVGVLAPTTTATTTKTTTTHTSVTSTTSTQTSTTLTTVTENKTSELATPAEIVVAVTKIEGLDFAALMADVAKKQSVIAAVEAALLARANAASGVTLTEDMLTSTIREAAARRLQEARRLAAGVFVDTEITPPSVTQITATARALTEASSTLATEVTTAVQKVAGIADVTISGATISATSSASKVAAVTSTTTFAAQEPVSRASGRQLTLMLAAFISIATTSGLRN